MDDERAERLNGEGDLLADFRVAVLHDRPVEVNSSRKIKADLFIDDRNLGGLPDWGRIYDMIHNGKTWQDYISPAPSPWEEDDPQPKKRWWKF